MIVIISAPSGCGKTSVARELALMDDDIVLSVSATTRPQRPSEVDGKDYFFKSRQDFKEIELLEKAEIYGHLYGTPRQYVEDQTSIGKDVLFDIDWQGAKQILESTQNIKVVTIFLLPPSINELKQRLKNRNTDSDETINMRLNEAGLEMTYSKYYDHAIINDNFDSTVQKVYSIITQSRK